MCGSELIPKPPGLTPSAKRLQALAQRVLKSADVPPSPCLSVCRMSDDTPYCEGCWRTLDEIANWAQRSVEDQRSVWGAIAQRLAAQTASG